MSSSGAFRWFIAAVLLLTIGWKAANQPETQLYLKNDLTKFFERNHFNVVVADANQSRPDDHAYSSGVTWGPAPARTPCCR